LVAPTAGLVVMCGLSICGTWAQNATRVLTICEQVAGDRTHGRSLVILWSGRQRRGGAGLSVCAAAEGEAQVSWSSAVSGVALAQWAATSPGLRLWAEAFADVQDGDTRSLDRFLVAAHGVTAAGGVAQGGGPAHSRVPGGLPINQGPVDGNAPQTAFFDSGPRGRVCHSADRTRRVRQDPIPDLGCWPPSWSGGS
jgi:hypothetical protein